VTFSNETASGWQEQRFGSAVAISSDTTYVASYHSPSGYLSSTPDYFTSGGYTNAPLLALGAAASGGNGVYGYGPEGTFPATPSPASANYWVDVVFAGSLGPDTNAPTVVGVSPVDGAVGVSVGTAVRVTFSEAMDAVTITNGTTITLSNGTAGLVAATVTYYATTNAAILTPNSPLAFTNLYTVRVKGGVGGVADVATNYLASDFTVSFTTEGPDLTPPVVVSASPLDGAVGVSLGTAVRVTFSEAMDGATINNGTITLSNEWIASSRWLTTAHEYAYSDTEQSTSALDHVHGDGGWWIGWGQGYGEQCARDGVQRDLYDAVCRIQHLG
jgi:hypothetical protein